MLDRRRFLSHTALALGASSLLPMGALAADRSGYKALVCVFLFGGCDSHDLLIGYDQPSYDGWARARTSILERFAESDSPGARSRENLLPLSPLNGGDFGSRQFAMPPETAGLHTLFGEGKLALVPNVGPLIEPVTRQEVRDKTALLPQRLQSHNDQQSTWQAFSGEGAKAGWGGLVLDAVGESSPYTAVSASGQTVFLSGQTTRHLQVPASGKIRRAYGTADRIWGSEELPARLRAYYRDAAEHLQNPMMRDIVRAQGKAVEDTEVLAELLSGDTIGQSVRIEGNRLSDQLGTIADLISVRGALGVNRQIFFAGMGGFDTHDNHAERMPALLGSLSEAVASFQTAMDAAGLSDQVTLFTASDFGRTLTANATGTDHGWGGHHMVVGGAVRGGRITGAVPAFEPDHERDFKRGALIPDLSVDQYGAELGRWFGLTAGELDAVFPNRRNFDQAEPALFL